MINVSRRSVISGLLATTLVAITTTEVAAMTKQRTTTENIVVHGAYTPPDMDIGAKEIDRWHRERGFLMIGYHKVIRRDGTIEDGRPEHLMGAGVSGYNDVSYHIVLVGGKAEEGGWETNYTGAQFDSLRSLIRQKLIQYPDSTLMGHTDFPRHTKKCPGFDVNQWYR